MQYAQYFGVKMRGRIFVYEKRYRRRRPATYIANDPECRNCRKNVFEPLIFASRKRYQMLWRLFSILKKFRSACLRFTKKQPKPCIKNTPPHCCVDTWNIFDKTYYNFIRFEVVKILRVSARKSVQVGNIVSCHGTDCGIYCLLYDFNNIRF